MQQKKISIIIVSFNVQDFLCLCLNSVIRAVNDMDAEVIVVDNNSSDESCRMVKELFPEVLLVENKDNKGFAKANNQAFAIAKGEFIHFLNPDTLLPEDFYRKSIPFLERHPEAGALGPKLIDGRGLYAPDSKKAFPSFWVSVYKVSGLSRLFRHSRKFNRYYAGHIQEDETAEVDILSGSCLLMRKSAIAAAGGSFDEAYFMYCEDVDLCHRVKLAGYKNYYFPEVTIIHYKGESTRKLSYKYMKVFYQAHALFVRKYYPKQSGSLYINALRLILAVRNFFNWGNHLFSLFKLFLLDTILLTLVTVGVTNFWFDSIAQVKIVETGVFLQTIPFFILIWLASLFLNGAYDKPFSLFKAGRGMVVGTVIVLAWYSLFPLSYRYSRGVVLFSGMTGTVVLLLTRWLLAALKWIRLVPRGKMDYKAAIISDQQHYAHSLAQVENNSIQASILGRIAVEETPSSAPVLGQKENLIQIQQLYGIDEFVFNSSSMRFKTIIQLMRSCASKSFFKIQVPGTGRLIGSHYGKHNVEDFLLIQKFVIGTPSARRNKRLLDIFFSLLFMFTYVFLSFRVVDKKGFYNNIKAVLFGRKTWVGYDMQTAEANHLPSLKTAVLPPYKVLINFTPGLYNTEKLSRIYASQFSVLDDVRFIWINFPFLGQ